MYTHPSGILWVQFQTATIKRILQKSESHGFPSACKSCLHYIVVY